MRSLLLGSNDAAVGTGGWVHKLCCRLQHEHATILGSNPLQTLETLHVHRHLVAHFFLPPSFSHAQPQMEVQNTIRRNAEDAQSYTQDLLKWQAEQSAADLRRRQAAASYDCSSAASQAPVRWESCRFGMACTCLHIGVRPHVFHKHYLLLVALPSTFSCL